MNRMRHLCLVIVLASAILGGCNKQTDAKVDGSAASSPANSAGVGGSAASPSAKPSLNPPEARVSDRPENTDGRVFVAMYHHVGDSKDSMYRKAAEFQADLEKFDKLGFRPVTASEYISGKMPLAPGASPVVMTFDDANPDQVRLLDDGTLDPTCFMGIWSEFAKTHPEFPIHATFFVLPSLFGQSRWHDKKLQMIKDWGSEIANHTLSHPILRKLSDDKVKDEIGGAADNLIKLGRRSPAPLALPFGVSPTNKELLKGFEWHGNRVEPTGVFLVGSNPAPSPSDPKFNRYAIPRIQANNVDQGLTYWFEQLEKGRVKLYVQP